MIRTRSDSTQVWVTNASAIGAGPGSVAIVNTAGWIIAVSNTAGLTTNIINSAGWIISVANTGGSVVVSNTQTAINIINSAGWIFAQSNTVQSVNIINSAGWIVNQANTGGLVIVGNSSNINIANSAGWSVVVSNTSPIAISNTAGWLINVANTGGSIVVTNTQTAINIINSAGWSVVVSNTSPIAISNTSGWIVNVANTGGVVSVANTANIIVYTIDSRPTVATVTLVASTIGQVALLAANVLRRSASVYNQSTNPLYLRLGSSVSATTYTLMIVSSGYYEVPNPVYTGIITGLWSAADGQAVITEAT